MQNVTHDKQIEIAWSKIAIAVAQRDLGALTKYFFWLRKLKQLNIIKY